MTSLLHPKTEVTSHLNWEAMALMGPKIALWPPLLLAIIQQNVSFWHISVQKPFLWVTVPCIARSLHT